MSDTTDYLLGSRQPPVKGADQLFQEQARDFHDATMEVRQAIREARHMAYAILTSDGKDPVLVQAIAKRWLDSFGHDSRDSEIPENCRALKS